ncbi:hypothetical protein [Mycobacterium sp. 1423905.2]|uniref:hypothetical protein n=1 Tax=Mycobacterium sp. 1423905.2 TaxID=1856859 RepID=UPI0007FECD22|nr:hypothetical protein [Mycobacterium sp. 1423905.2]OBJ50758.1 hypothetical protein A9W95_23310 [Mycobacterium sp. 1423905.2]
MVYTGNVAVGGVQPAGDADASGVSIPGLIAAGAWALGLVVGLIALTTSHLGVAAVALVAAVISPWVGLAWIRGVQRRAVPFAGMPRRQGPSTASFTGGLPGLRLTAN